MPPITKSYVIIRNGLGCVQAHYCVTPQSNERTLEMGEGTEGCLSVSCHMTSEHYQSPLLKKIE